MAVALSFCGEEVKSLATPATTFNHMDKYRMYVEWHDEGLLFNVFSSVSAWHLRYVVSTWQSREELVWARQNVMEGYRTPLKIADVTHKMVQYTAHNPAGVSIQDGPEFYGCLLPYRLD